MKPFVLYCKSYSVDVRRVKRLAQSVQEFNVDRLDFYVSCPQQDMDLFRSYLQGLDVQLINDEEIILANPAHSLCDISQIPGNISQQIIKSEFWRIKIARNYFCLDSDCKFIRPFTGADFLTTDGTPYTIIDECRDILIPAAIAGKHRVIDDFRRESADIQRCFERNGKMYNFGPNCPIWSADVWASLDENYLKPNRTSFAEVIVKHPIEMRWYGEALLKYRAIAMHPSQPLIKMYAYAWQLKKDRSDGIREETLAQFYCGVTYQSAWEREMDWPSEGGSFLSIAARRARRALGRT